MRRSKLPPWIGPAVGGVALAAFVVVFALAWAYSSRIGALALDAEAAPLDLDLVVSELGGGRIVVPRTERTIVEGVWGLAADDAYGQLGSIVQISENDVERGFKTFEGSFSVGDRVAIDQDAFPGDPSRAHALGFDNVRVPADLGPNPAWFIDGRRTTWVIIVHGRGHDRRQALRILPALVEEGFPVLVVSYRNDGIGTPDRSGTSTWGLDEWRDLDAALALAQRKGAASFVLMGFDTGAEIISMTLHESSRTADVLGAVFDGPVLDLDDVARDLQPGWAPGPIGVLGRELAEIRFSLDWEQLDQIARADQFDVPILILHGAKDPVVPIDRSLAFVEARPDLVSLERFERAGHGDLWNTDLERYQNAVVGFLFTVAGEE